VRLRFDPEKDEYYDGRDEILTAFERWARRRGDVDDGWGHDACVFLDWRVGYSTGDLAAFTGADVEDYLLDWCPRKLSFAPEHWLGVVEGVEAWLLFLVESGQWTGGLVQPMLALPGRLTPRFLDEMANPAKFGMAKTLFAGPGLAGADLDLDDPASIQAAIDAFNSLPFEERKAATDPGLSAMTRLHEPIELPMTPVADLGRAATEAAAAPILVQLRAVIDYLGTGRALTPKGNPKLVDARALLELVPTDDVADVSTGRYQRTLRSADDLPHLMFLIEAAQDAGALRRHGGKLVGVKAFASREPLDQIEALLAAMIEIGPIFGRGVTRYHSDEAGLIEDGLFHWMVPVFVDGSHQVDEIVDQAVEVVTAELPRRWTSGDPAQERESVAREVEKVLDVVERCGLVTRHEAGEQADRYTGRVLRRGGVLLLTELGRALLPAWLGTAGYRAHDSTEMAALEARDLLETFGSGAVLEPREVWALWAPQKPPSEKAAAIIAAMLSADSPHARLAGLSLLHADPRAAEDPIRTLLGTPLAGHAAMLLLDHGLIEPGDAEMIDPGSAFGPLVDMLAVELDDDPGALAERFDELVGPQPLEALGLIWRVDLPEALEVLGALGQRHPVKAVAKAARKAALQHRSRYPG